MYGRPTARNEHSLRYLILAKIQLALSLSAGHWWAQNAFNVGAERKLMTLNYYSHPLSAIVLAVVIRELGAHEMRVKQVPDLRVHDWHFGPFPQAHDGAPERAFNSRDNVRWIVKLGDIIGE